jgi:hypothetical protein
MRSSAKWRCGLRSSAFSHFFGGADCGAPRFLTFVEVLSAELHVLSQKVVDVAFRIFHFCEFLKVSIQTCSKLQGHIFRLLLMMTLRRWECKRMEKMYMKQDKIK